MTDWTINLADSTATHASGLAILFEPAEDAAGAWDGQVISDIPPTMALDAQAVALLMREAGGDSFAGSSESVK